jgi:hypothetical protein
LKITEVAQIFWIHFSLKNLSSILTKLFWARHILDDFLTKSSGHPVFVEQCRNSQESDIVFHANAAIAHVAMTSKSSIVCRDQGDQVGRIFTLGSIVYFGQFFNYKSSSIFLGLTLFHEISHELILWKKWVGLHFGRLFRKLIRSPWSGLTIFKWKAHTHFAHFEVAMHG